MSDLPAQVGEVRRQGHVEGYDDGPERGSKVNADREGVRATGAAEVVVGWRQEP